MDSNLRKENRFQNQLQQFIPRKVATVEVHRFVAPAPDVDCRNSCFSTNDFLFNPFRFKTVSPSLGSLSGKFRFIYDLLDVSLIESSASVATSRMLLVNMPFSERAIQAASWLLIDLSLWWLVST